MSEIRFFGPNWAPRNWMPCDGSLLPISNFTALFSLIGTSYGGDGRTTFALPDLRGRVIVGSGSGPGRTPRLIGQASGQENVTLTMLDMPSHTHLATTQLSSASVQIASTAPGTAGTPTAGSHPGVVVNADGDPVNIYAAGGNPVTSPVSGNANTQLSPSGGGQSHNNMQPWLCVMPIICIQGVYPSRN
jgi:microcystin-dependent protein